MNYYSLFFIGLGTYLVNKIYKKRHTIIINLLKTYVVLKKTFEKELTKQDFYPKQLIVEGKYMNFNKKFKNKINFTESVENISYYTGSVNFILLYEFNNVEYFFIRKNYLINCLKDLSEFIQELNEKNENNRNNNNNSKILNCQLTYDNKPNVDITEIIKKIEGINKDFNCECVLLSDLYKYFKDKDIDIKNSKLVIIDNLAEEHILNYDDIIKI